MAETKGWHENETNNWLPGFASIKLKTNETLYEHGTDKSPKGFVDAPIRPLVDLLNQHPALSTLSSCSGRIVVFRQNTDQTVKGGEWLLVSHDQVTCDQVRECFRGPLAFFRFEPFLLHVAAATLAHGQKLLQCALGAGMRESGLIVTDKRVTVALRSFGRTLVVPLWELPPQLDQLVEMGNQRLHETHQHMQRLTSTIQQQLFPQTKQKLPLPDLNLWGHVLIASTDSVVTMGGYGFVCEGAPMCRHDDVFRLSRVDGMWQQQWEKVEPVLDTTCTRWHGIPVSCTKWSGREFAAGCNTSLGAVLFGGRTSPGKPLSDLLLMDPKTCCFYRPEKVQGTCPSARWGHTLTALGGERKEAVLIGGRNEQSSLVDHGYIFTLRWITETKGPNTILQWNGLMIHGLMTDRFHHLAVSIDSSRIFLFGGITMGTKIAQWFDSDAHPSMISFETDGAVSEFVEGDDTSVFGACANKIPANFEEEASVTSHRLLVCGGAGMLREEHNLLRWMDLKQKDSGMWLARMADCGDFDFQNMGAMVHHASVQVSANSGETELVIAGGGTSGFAFRPCFSKSYALRISGSGPRPETLNPSTLSPAFSVQTKERGLKVPVLYVPKRQAKLVKCQLEATRLISEVYRIGPADAAAVLTTPSDFVAIPVVETAIEQWNSRKPEEHDNWKSIVQGVGLQSLQLRSSTFATLANHSQ